MKHLKYLFILFGVLFLAACGSRKKALDATSGTTPDAVDHSAAALEKIVHEVNSNRLSADALTAKMSLALSAGQKSVNVGGTLRMKRNDVIQLNLVMLGLMEVGRMELTKDYFMVVNRMEHEYVKASYEDIAFLRTNGIDFFTFQSLFWDELFVAGDRGAVPAPKRYQKTLEGDDLKLVNSDSRQMVLTFLANVASGMVHSTSFSSKERADQPVLDWQYQEYSKLNRQSFPSRMQIRVNASSKPLVATISLSHIKASDDWEKRTQLSKRYTPITVESAFNSIMRLAK